MNESFEKVLSQKIRRWKKDYKNNKLDIIDRPIRYNIILGNTHNWFETMNKLKKENK